MKIDLFREDETIEEFEKISDAIIRDLVELRGMPTDNGQFMKACIDELKHDDATYEITMVVHRVKCSRHDDF